MPGKIRTGLISKGAVFRLARDKIEQPSLQCAVRGMMNLFIYITSLPDDWKRSNFRTVSKIRLVEEQQLAGKLVHPQQLHNFSVLGKNFSFKKSAGIVDIADL